MFAVVVTIDGTQMIEEPITKVLQYRATRFHALQKSGPMVEVEFEDETRMFVFADEIFIKSV